jgi:hypothetical protein
MWNFSEAAGTVVQDRFGFEIKMKFSKGDYLYL